MSRRTELQARREALGFRQDTLAEHLEVRPYTVHRWEAGTSTPSARYRRPLAEALQISLEALDRMLAGRLPINTKIVKDRGEEGFRVHASRFIPVFIGDKKQAERLIRRNFSAYGINGTVNIDYDEDGVAVIIIRDETLFPSTIEFLKQRRDTHLRILENRERLLVDVSTGASPPLYVEKPGIEYVMSVHWLADTDSLTEQDLLAMSVPSLVGITDDANQAPASDDEASALLGALDLAENDSFSIVSSHNGKYYTSWANVLLCGGTFAEYQSLEVLEIQLQRLWYQLYFCDLRLTELDQPICAETRRAIQAVYMDFSRFSQVSSRASTSANNLTRALVDTSKIRSLSDSIREKLELLR